MWPGSGAATAASAPVPTAAIGSTAVINRVLVSDDEFSTVAGVTFSSSIQMTRASTLRIRATKAVDARFDHC